MTDQQCDVMVAGQLCLDIIPEISDYDFPNSEEILIPGKLNHVGAARINTGGPVSNVGIALSKMGLKSNLVARIGDDEFGRIIHQLLDRQDFSTNLITTPEIHTSYTITIAPPGIDRIYLYGPGANGLFTSKDLNKKILSKTKLFHFGYPPSVLKVYENEGDDLVKMLKLAKSFELTTSLDMTLPGRDSLAGKAPWKRILEKTLPYVDIFMPSIEEIFFMLDPTTYMNIKDHAGNKEAIKFIDPHFYSKLASNAIELGAKIVGIKTGFRGLYVQTRDLTGQTGFGQIPPKDKKNWTNRELWCPAFRMSEIASATGSGDSAFAGFLAAYFRGLSIEKTLKYATCLGYQNLHQLDAVSGVKDWKKTTEMLNNKNMKLVDIPELKNSSWNWDEKKAVWTGEKDHN